MSTLSYRQARTVVLGFGTALICGVGIASFFRGADLVEVLAVLLFLPVLFGLAFGMIRGGLLAGVVSSIAYLAVRFTSLGGLPVGDFIGIGVVRVLLYAGLGVFGGWANEMLAHALRKLELYDEVDDVTGVGNGRAVLSVTDREAARADRYGSVFSCLVVEVAGAAFEGASARQIRRALRQACQTVEASVRATDAVNRVPLDDGREEVIVVLPETGRVGAELVLGRLVDGTRQLLSEHGLAVGNGRVAGRVISYPGDDGELARLRSDVARAVGMPVAEETPA